MKLNEAMGMSAIMQDTEGLISAIAQYLENHMDYVPEDYAHSVARAYRDLKEFKADMREQQGL